MYQKGTIKIDSISIDEYDVDALRSKIGIVFEISIFLDRIQKIMLPYVI